MLTIASQIVDIALNILVIILAAKWAARRAGRMRAVLFGAAAGLIYSVISDFSITYLTPDYDHSLEAVTGNALATAAIGLPIAFLATLRRRARIENITA